MLLACACLVAACDTAGGSRSTPADTSTQASPSTSAASPSPSGAEADVLRTYRKLQDAVTQAYAHPKRSPKAVERYAWGTERSEIFKTVFRYRQQQIRLTGAPKVSPRVSSIDEKRQVAAIIDCFDDSDWTPVDAHTGKSLAAPGQNHRYQVTAQARKVDGHWYVVSSKADREQTCSPG